MVLTEEQLQLCRTLRFKAQNLEEIWMGRAPETGEQLEARLRETEDDLARFVEAYGRLKASAPPHGEEG